MLSIVQFFVIVVAANNALDDQMEMAIYLILNVIVLVLIQIRSHIIMIYWDETNAPPIE
jgi:hypothetical protein